jgi:hypothetical protein
MSETLGSTVTIVPGTLFLPPNARPDLGFQTTPDGEPVDGGATEQYVAGGVYIDIVVSIGATFTYGGSSTGIYPYARLSDQNGNVLAWIPSVVDVSTKPTTFFSWITDISAAYGLAGEVVTLPLPVMPMYPMYTWLIGGIDTAKGDTMTGITWNTVRIPTGPALDSETTTAVASPVLV